MTPEQIEQLKIDLSHALSKTVESSIDRRVNGGISRLTETVNKHIQEDREWKENYEREDTEWKERAQPAVNLGNNINAFNSVGMKIIGALAALGGLYLLVTNIFKK